MTAQLDNDIAGLEVRLPNACRCGNQAALIGAGVGPHRASLNCRECTTLRGWLSDSTYEFLRSIAAKFGRPLTPIVIRRTAIAPTTAAQSKLSHTATEGTYRVR
jgi:hypothetical protein